MIQAVLEILGEWLLSGSDRGPIGKIRKWLLIIFGSFLVLALGAAYFANLSTMSLGLAIGLPIFAISLSGIGCAIYFAARSSVGNADKN